MKWIKESFGNQLQIIKPFVIIVVKYNEDTIWHSLKEIQE